jgi:3-hydroxymyristoyl/3-hydroxydecanoyl-(acyl carrier protein) dehydratase
MEGDGFLGFAAVDDVKFRGSVQPGDTVLMIGKMVEVRKRRCIGQTQAFVNDKMVYEGLITGMWL